MRPKSRATRVAFRRAVWASVALHAVVVCAGGLVFRAAEEREYAGPRVSTVVDDPQVRISQTEETFAIAEPPVEQPQVAPAQPQAAHAPPALPAPPLAAAPAVPQTLPPELLAIIRKPAATPVGGVVVEVAVPPGAANPPVTDPNVKPAGGPGAGVTPGRAIHGALAAGQTVVYVLDCSGSMGAAGKFDAARAALVATLAQQPPTVRFQVIVYAGTAKPLLASDGKGLPATADNVRLCPRSFRGWSRGGSATITARSGPRSPSART